MRNLSLLAVAAVWVACSKTQAPEKPAGMAPSAVPAPAPAAEPAPAPPDPKDMISGTIIVPPARKKDVKAGDTIFIIARRAAGPPGPASMLAVQKHQVGDLPMPFALSARDSMIPGTPFEGEVSIIVRVDKDGDAMTRRKGDVLGQANNVKVGARDVTISLDTLQPEDVTLGGGAPAPGLPPGHP